MPIHPTLGRVVVVEGVVRGTEQVINFYDFAKLIAMLQYSVSVRHGIELPDT
jgi:hypothetical protein